MKKVLALILALVLCLGLVACGASSSGSNGSGKHTFLYQEWRRTRDGKLLSFEKNGNCVLGDKEYKYEYNDELGVISIYTAATMNLTVVQDGDAYQLTGSGTFVPTETFRNEYMDEAIASAVGAASELLIGHAYTTRGGVEFTLEKAELIEKGTEYFWSFTFVCDEELVIRESWYSSPSETAGHPIFQFDLNDSSDGANTLNFISKKGLSRDKAIEDAELYGVLSLTIGIGDNHNDDNLYEYGSDYYIVLETLFE